MDVQALVAQQLPSLGRYASYLARNRGRADDLVQETVLRALTRIHHWQCGTNLRAWLFCIMHSQHINQVRRSTREAQHFSDETPVVPIEGRQEHSVVLADLARALSSIPREQQVVLRMVSLEGLSYAQAATRLGLSLGTVRSRVSRGRQALRALLDGHLPHSPGQHRADSSLRAARVAEQPEKRYVQRPSKR